MTFTVLTTIRTESGAKRKPGLLVQVTGDTRRNCRAFCRTGMRCSSAAHWKGATQRCDSTRRRYRRGGRAGSHRASTRLDRPVRSVRAALDDIEGDDATDFCDGALDAWQHIGLPNVTHAGPQALVIFEALNALAKVGTAAAMDWADTPDVRDRYTRDSAQQLVSDALDDVVSECKRWLSEGLPPSDAIQQRFTAVAGELKKSMEVLGRRTPSWTLRTSKRRQTSTARFCFTATPTGRMHPSSRRCVRSLKRKTPGT